MEAIMSRDGNSTSFGIGVLLGVVAVVIAGVLYAPKSGEETRKSVENTVCDLVEKHAPEIERTKREALTSIDVMRYKFEKKYKRFLAVLRAKQMAKAKAKETSDYEMN